MATASRLRGPCSSRMSFPRDARPQLSTVVVSSCAALQNRLPWRKISKRVLGLAKFVSEPSPTIHSEPAKIQLRSQISATDPGRLAPPPPPPPRRLRLGPLPHRPTRRRLTLPPDIPIKTIDGQPAAARRFPWAGAAYRQRREQVRFHPAIRLPRGAAPPRFRARPSPCSASYLRPVRPSGAGRRGRLVRSARMRPRCDVPDVRQDRGQRRRSPAAVTKALRRSCAWPQQSAQAIKWNFTKFLIDWSRRVVRRYAPSDKPRSSPATSRLCPV